jgi:hypothetical protein
MLVQNCLVGMYRGSSGNISTELPGWKGLGNLGTNMYVHFSVCCRRLLFESSTRIKKGEAAGGGIGS